MKQPKTKKFKHQKDLIAHWLKNLKPVDIAKKIERAKDRLRGT